MVFALFITLAPAYAQGLKIELVSEQTALLPGRPFTLGLWLQHPEGSHTYWRSPGIVGVPTQMEWKLPQGWKASALIYPEPERTLMYQIKAQGYDRDVMLRTEIIPPADLKPGTQVTLTGQASWMCCGNSCNPGTRELSITLPVVATQAEIALNENWHKLLEAERARGEGLSDAWTASTVSEKGNILTLTLKPASAEACVPQDQEEAAKIIVFTEDGWFDSDEPQTIIRQPDGSLSITLTKADAFLGDEPPDTLRAILRNEQGWLKGGKLRCLQITPTIERASVPGD
ncbi:MAG TPA: protein-disulfide reductase DsbD domain-containing protein [Prosthecobacter sp.]